MTQPLSLKERTFFALPSPLNNSTLKDDFVHKKIRNLES